MTKLVPHCCSAPFCLWLRPASPVSQVTFDVIGQPNPNLTRTKLTIKMLRSKLEATERHLPSAEARALPSVRPIRVRDDLIADSLIGQFELVSPIADGLATPKIIYFLLGRHSC